MRLLSLFISCLLVTGVNAVSFINDFNATAVAAGNYQLNVTLVSATVEPCRFQLVQVSQLGNSYQTELVADLSGHGEHLLPFKVDTAVILLGQSDCQASSAGLTRVVEPNYSALGFCLAIVALFSLLVYDYWRYTPVVDELQKQ